MRLAQEMRTVQCQLITALMPRRLLGLLADQTRIPKLPRYQDCFPSHMYKGLGCVVSVRVQHLCKAVRCSMLRLLFVSYMTNTSLVSGHLTHAVLD